MEPSDIDAQCSTDSALDHMFENSKRHARKAGPKTVDAVPKKESFDMDYSLAAESMLSSDGFDMISNIDHSITSEDRREGAADCDMDTGDRAQSDVYDGNDDDHSDIFGSLEIGGDDAIHVDVECDNMTEDEGGRDNGGDILNISEPTGDDDMEISQDSMALTPAPGAGVAEMNGDVPVGTGFSFAKAKKTTSNP